MSKVSKLIIWTYRGRSPKWHRLGSNGTPFRIPGDNTNQLFRWKILRDRCVFSLQLSSSSYYSHFLCQNNTAGGTEGDSVLLIKECPQHWQSHLKKHSLCILPEEQWPEPPFENDGQKSEHHTLSLSATVNWAARRPIPPGTARTGQRAGATGTGDSTRDEAQAQGPRPITFPACAKHKTEAIL